MKEGPDISIVASSVGEPARANMLMALMSGVALTATELAREAGVMPPTASGHLAKLESAGLVCCVKQGRHRYYRIADPDVAQAVEALVTIAARVGHLRTRPGPKDEAMRRARSCYDHLAGHLAVDLFARWTSLGVLRSWKGETQITRKGRAFLGELGIEVHELEKRKRSLCRACIDWSERRNHLGGSVGSTILSCALEKGWAVREGNSRVLHFSLKGEQLFKAWYSGQNVGHSQAAE